ncbi:DUF4102 domain-containing protein [Paracoccus limosus]|uniref:DUF4102 domain-containing protein n=1 Tax=Paracoccus limosus TaxID=913252 RepID=A0A844H8F0_9RHOB|nr:site-specific integrase [Paracoccus limosus]MTH34678.1 DUF4102 domain-containing protein [Paracoccus limosus]
MPKITKTAVDGMEVLPGQETYLWDSALAGFGVRVTKSGSKSYVLKYRTRTGLSRKMVLGRVGTLTADEARRQAIKTLGEIATGGDPSADRKAERQRMTVAELADLYVEAMQDRWKTNTYKTNTSQIETHIKPLIGKLPAPDLSYADVERMRRTIARGRTANKPRGRGGATVGGKGAATRSVVVLGGILNHGMRLDLVSRNVAEKVIKDPIGKRTRFLSFAELTRLGEVLGDSPGEPWAGLQAIRFLLLTGFRRNEALRLRGNDCHPEQGYIALPDTKTGAQLRSVGAIAFEGLTLHNEIWVFPGCRGEGHFVGLPKCLGRVCAEAGIPGISAHTLRHTFAATAATLGYSELTIAGLLGHSAGSVTARYAHVADIALKSAANRTANAVAAALEGRDPMTIEGSQQ